MRIVIDLVNDSPEDPPPLPTEEAVDPSRPPVERLELTIEETEPPPSRNE